MRVRYVTLPLFLWGGLAVRSGATTFTCEEALVRLLVDTKVASDTPAIARGALGVNTRGFARIVAKARGVVQPEWVPSALGVTLRYGRICEEPADLDGGEAVIDVGCFPSDDAAFTFALGLEIADRFFRLHSHAYVALMSDLANGRLRGVRDTRRRVYAERGRLAFAHLFTRLQVRNVNARPVPGAHLPDFVTDAAHAVLVGRTMTRARAVDAALNALVDLFHEANLMMIEVGDDWAEPADVRTALIANFERRARQDEARRTLFQGQYRRDERTPPLKGIYLEKTIEARGTRSRPARVEYAILVSTVQHGSLVRIPLDPVDPRRGGAEVRYEPRAHARPLADLYGIDHGRIATDDSGGDFISGPDSTVEIYCGFGGRYHEKATLWNLY